MTRYLEMKMYKSKIVVSLFGTFAVGLVACGTDDPPEDEGCQPGEVCLCVTDADCATGQVCSQFLICETAEVEDTGDADVADDADVGLDVGDVDGDAADVSDSGIIPGACSNEADDRLLLEDGRPECAIACQTAPDFEACVGPCVEGAGLSTECGQCFIDESLCFYETCPSCRDGISEECLACADSEGVACREELEVCAGYRPPEEEEPEDAICEEGEAEAVGVDTLLGVAEDCLEQCGDEGDDCLFPCVGEDVSVNCGRCFLEHLLCVELECVDACAEGQEECDACEEADACANSLAECMQIEVVVPEEILARVRLLHLSPDLPAVSAYLQGEELPFASTVVFGDASENAERIVISSETIEIREASLGTEGDVLYEETFERTPVPSDVWTLAVYGAAEEGTAWLLSHDREDRPGTVRWQFFNAATLFGAVDIYDLDSEEPTELFGGLDYAASTERAETEVGQARVGIDTDDDGTSDYEFIVGPFEFGTEVSLFLYDDGVEEVFLMGIDVDGRTSRYIPEN